MHLKRQSSAPLRALASSLLLPAAFGAGAWAQEAPAPPPGVLESAPLPPAAAPISPAPATPLPPTGGISQIAGGAIAGTAEPAPTGPTLFQWGPVQLHPHALYRFLYGNGLQFSPGAQADTVINEFSPGILFNIGSHWQLDYTPTLRFYSSSQFQNGTDQSVRFSGGTTYQDWTFGLSQAYLSTSQPLVETAAQTSQENYNTALNASYSINSKLSLDLGINQHFLFVEQSVPGESLTDSRSWSASDWLNYKFAPRLTGAIGTVFGYDNPQVGSDMTSEQLQGRVSWGMGQKLTLSANAGFEVRQFLGSDVPDGLYPIFGVSALYQLFPTTTLSLNASRTVGYSYFQNQITETTAVTAGLQQRLLGRLSLGLTGGYNLASYQATTTAVAVSRQDSFYNFNARLSCPFLERGTASVFYSWSENTSNEAGFQYTSHQIGAELGYRF